MNLDSDLCYKALRTHDSRFDGCFFVGVVSTGIYCRPVCRVRAPRPENCRYFTSSAAAERQGFRPCLRCRPDQAPGNAPVDAASRLLHYATEQIDTDLLCDQSIDGLAARLGITPRHLRRLFQQGLGVSPLQYIQSQRLRLACQLLSESRLPVAELALGSGFSSLRRFNSLFREHYRMTPTEWRRRGASGAGTAQLRFHLGYRPPLDWSRLLGFLARRALPGVERIDADGYRRTVRLRHGSAEHRGWIEVRPDPDKARAEVQLAPSLLPVLPQVLTRVRRLFDLQAHPDAIAERLGALVISPGIRLPGAFDGFEQAVRAIIGQQVSVAAARTLAHRFCERFGDPVETGQPGLDRIFPDATSIAALDAKAIAGLGIVGARARALIALAQAAADDPTLLQPGIDIDDRIARLQALPGIGPWTAQYIAMRALSWPDAFPHSDLGLLKALNTRSPAEALARAEPWRPWRAYAVMHLWLQLEEAPQT